MRKALFLVIPVVLILGWLGLNHWQFLPLALPANAPKPLVMGHAGSGFLTPFNPFNPLPPSSFAAVQHALELGADGVEVDVQLSQDSIPMLYHDGELHTSTTGGTGCISRHPAAELVRLRYHGGLPYDWFQHEQLVALDTVLRAFQQKKPFPYLHLDLHEEDMCAAKGQTFTRSPILARQLAQRLTRYQVPGGRLLIISNQVRTLRYLRTLLPAVPLALEIDKNFDAEFKKAQAVDLQALVIKKDQLTPERVAQIRAAGLQLVLFGGRGAATIKQQLAYAPNAIQTDNVAGLLSLLNRSAPAQ